MSLKYFNCWKPCNLTYNVHLYDAFCNKYKYLKPRVTITTEYDVNTESYILRIYMDKFLKETIEIQSIESESKVKLIGSKYFLKNIERSEHSESSEANYMNEANCMNK